MNGVINFLKPPGMSSNGAVVFLRRLLGVKKTGHAGTLDPGACGVLPVCVGKATRISAYMMGGEKEYICEVTFGKSTDTGDSYGCVTRETSAAPPDEAAVRAELERFRGSQMQRTPAYSAVKKDGVPLYKLARRGIQTAAVMRKVVIRDIAYLQQTGPASHLLRVTCGKGTYIRQLCEDIGESFGLPAYMSFLVRTKCAGLDIEHAYTADALKELDGDFSGVLLPTDTFLAHLPRAVAKGNGRLLKNGGTVPCDAPDMAEARVYLGDEFLGIGTVSNGQLKISTLLVDI